MTWQVDAQLGTNFSTASGVTSLTLTTTNPVAPGGLIILACGHFSNVVATASGGSLAWNTDIRFLSGSDVCYLIAAPAPAGLATSTVITVSFSSTGAGNPIIGATSFMPAGTATLNQTASNSNASGLPWLSGAVNTQGVALVIAAAWTSSRQTTSAPNPGWTQSFNIQNTAGETLNMVYALDLNPGTWQPGGAWAAAAVGVCVTDSYTVPGPFAPHRMPLGV